MVNIDSFAKGFNMLIFLKDLYCLLWSWVWLLWPKQRTERFDSHRHLQTRHIVQQFYLYAAEAWEVSLTVDYMPQTWLNSVVANIHGQGLSLEWWRRKIHRPSTFIGHRLLYYFPMITRMRASVSMLRALPTFCTNTFLQVGRSQVKLSKG